MITFNQNIESLKDAIMEREVIENILVKTSGGYHVVTGSIVYFYDYEYAFYFDGFSFSLSIDEVIGFVFIE